VIAGGDAQPGMRINYLGASRGNRDVRQQCDGEAGARSGRP